VPQDEVPLDEAEQESVEETSSESEGRLDLLFKDK
jgi:hypothetical protein